MSPRTEPAASVDTDHHIGRLDDGECFLPDFQTKLVYGRVGDGRRHDDPAADFNFNVRGRCTLGHLDDLALEAIACADLHVTSPVLSMLQGSTMRRSAPRSDR